MLNSTKTKIRFNLQIGIAIAINVFSLIAIAAQNLSCTRTNAELSISSNLIPAARIERLQVSCGVLTGDAFNKHRSRMVHDAIAGRIQPPVSGGATAETKCLISIVQATQLATPGLHAVVTPELDTSITGFGFIQSELATNSQPATARSNAKRDGELELSQAFEHFAEGCSVVPATTTSDVIGFWDHDVNFVTGYSIVPAATTIGTIGPQGGNITIGTIGPQGGDITYIRGLSPDGQPIWAYGHFDQEVQRCRKGFIVGMIVAYLFRNELWGIRQLLCSLFMPVARPTSYRKSIQFTNGTDLVKSHIRLILILPILILIIHNRL